MDFAQVAAYFDNQDFDTYNFTSDTWDAATFQGQLKRADDFISIWNRPTRKRLLYTALGVTIPSAVIRVPSTAEVFMTGHASGDSHANTNYRTLRTLHQAEGTAVQYRKTPVVNSGIKGWAVEATVDNTFADVELRSVNENQDMQLLNYGSFFMFMPSNTVLLKHDSVLLDGKRYYVLESYKDSGLVCARVTTTPDERVDFVYRSVSVYAYNPATQTAGKTYVDYNTTAKVRALSTEELKGSEISKDIIEVLILESFISYVPKLDDLIVYLGQTYTVTKVSRDPGLEEWRLLATL